MIVLLSICGVIVITFIVLVILDHFNVTHIFMKGRPSGTISSAMRAMQDALEPQAHKAHEYVIEEREEKDKSQTYDSKKSDNG